MSINTLKDSRNVRLGRSLNDLESKVQFTEVPAIGDGNCAYNAFALGLIDLIHRDHQVFTDANFQIFKQTIRAAENLETLRQRIAMYEGKPSSVFGLAYTSLVPHLNNFIQFISQDNPEPDLTAFLTYIRAQKSHEEIAALHVALAPALRMMSINEYLHADDPLLDRDDTGKIQEAFNRFLQDGKEAGDDTLQPLATALGIRLSIYKTKALHNIELYSDTLQTHAPKISLLNTPGHWNFLIPKTQQNGLISDLQDNPISTNKPTSPASRDTNNRRWFGDWAIEASELLKSQNKQEVKMTLANMGRMMSEVSESLLTEMSDADKAKESAFLSSETDRVINAVRRKLGVEYLKGLIPSDTARGAFERMLLAGEVEKDHSPRKQKAAEENTDEALARSLQNAEILKFLGLFYEAPKVKTDIEQPKKDDSLKKSKR